MTTDLEVEALLSATHQLICGDSSCRQEHPLMRLRMSIIEKVLPTIWSAAREQAAQDIEQYNGPPPWGHEGTNAVQIRSWIDSHDAAQAAALARGITPPALETQDDH